MSAEKENQNEKDLPFYEALGKAKSLQIKNPKKEPTEEEFEVKETFNGG